MSPAASAPIEPAAVHGVDSEGELYTRPAWLKYVIGALLALTVIEAVNEVIGIGGPSTIYENWIHNIVILGAGLLVLGRAVYEPTTRKAWLAFGFAMLLWSIGTIAWTIVYDGVANPPYPTFADVLWLAWYPLMALGITLLIRVHRVHFELHRWMDGLAVTLLVLAAGFALIIQPAAHDAAQGPLATVIDFSYPVLDVLLIGAVLGVYGLLGWRPDRMWILIGLGVLATTIGDAAFAVQEARGTANSGHYQFVWTLGAVLIACAAWVTSEKQSEDEVAVTGLRAVALLLVAQALAAGIQIYALFGELGKSERIITLMVLVVTSIQIVLNRPKPAAATASSRPRGTSEALDALPGRGGEPAPSGGETQI